MFPIIPFLAIAAIIGGIATLSWYSKLSPEEKREANKKMNQLAIKLYARNYDLLNQEQKKVVSNQIRKEFEAKKN